LQQKIATLNLGNDYFKKPVLRCLSFCTQLKMKICQWKSANLDQQIKLKHTRVVAEKALEAELKKKSVQLAHEITLLTN